MKLSEVIAILEENPNKIFVSEKCTNYEMRIYTFDGHVHIKYPNGDRLCGISTDREWEEVKEPVIWQEAIQAWLEGNEFSIEIGTSVYRQYPNEKLGYLYSKDYSRFTGFTDSMFTDGKWYID